MLSSFGVVSSCTPTTVSGVWCAVCLGGGTGTILVAPVVVCCKAGATFWSYYECSSITEPVVLCSGWQGGRSTCTVVLYTSAKLRTGLFVLLTVSDKGSSSLAKCDTAYGLLGCLAADDRCSNSLEGSERLIGGASPKTSILYSIALGGACYRL